MVTGMLAVVDPVTLAFLTWMLTVVVTALTGG